MLRYFLIITNFLVSITSVICNALVSYFSNKDKNLEEKYKFNRFLSKEAVEFKEDTWIVKCVKG